MIPFRPGAEPVELCPWVFYQLRLRCVPCIRQYSRKEYVMLTIVIAGALAVLLPLAGGLLALARNLGC